MSVNNINNVNNTAAYTTASVQQNTRISEMADTAKTSEKVDTAKTSAENTGVVYEKSSASTQKTTYSRESVIARLKADTEARTAQLKSLVEQMMSTQGTKIGQADDMWKFLASGNYTVSPEVKAQAQADIAEDGYWGVEQTSDRIVEFAKALTGGDSEKAEEMRAAFEKGFKAATKSWGSELPDISQRTYDAVMQKFDEWAGVSAAEE